MHAHTKACTEGQSFVATLILHVQYMAFNICMKQSCQDCKACKFLRIHKL